MPPETRLLRLDLTFTDREISRFARHYGDQRVFWGVVEVGLCLDASGREYVPYGDTFPSIAGTPWARRSGFDIINAECHC
jgi:hypothetical protein